jgi:hypothetical protein
MPLTPDDPFFIPPFLRKEARATPKRRGGHKSGGTRFSNPGTEPQPLARRRRREAYRTAVAYPKPPDQVRRKRVREAGRP